MAVFLCARFTAPSGYIPAYNFNETRGFKMKARDFEAVAVHPEAVSKEKKDGTMIGVWIGWEVSPAQAKKLKAVTTDVPPGNLGVFIDKKTHTTTVTCLTRAKDQRGGRDMLGDVVRVVKEITGARSVLVRRLPDHLSVSRALAVPAD